MKLYSIKLTYYLETHTIQSTTTEMVTKSFLGQHFKLLAAVASVFRTLNKHN